MSRPRTYKGPPLKGQDIEMKDVAIRMGSKGDLPFIFKRTLRELRHWPFLTGMPDGLYHQYTHRALEAMLLRCATLVAYPSPKVVKMEGSTMVRHGSPNRILGYIICDPTDLGLVVHMVYTRKTFDDNGMPIDDYRRRGIATKLIQSAIEQFRLPDDKIFWTVKTSSTKYYPELRERIANDERFIFHPYLFFTLLEPGWETGIRTPSQGPVSAVLKSIQEQV